MTPTATATSTDSGLDLHALDRFLSDSEWEIRTATRVLLEPGDPLPTWPTTTLVYVHEGTVAAPGSEPHDRLRAGHLLLDSSGAVRLYALSAGSALVAEVVRVRAPERGADLPATISIADLPAREPSAAALVSMLGCDTAPSPVDGLVCARIVTTLLTVALRRWAVQGCAPQGWPAPTIDPYLQQAIDAVHADLAHPWSVAELAARSAMGRSAFAERFRSCLGVSPAEYVTTARMTAAARRLRIGEPVSLAARAVGYDSDEGFRRAFRRHTGVAPSEWRERADTANTTPPTIATMAAARNSVNAPL
ncbi:helix-turn-helix domain-containing protein [Microbacterium gorillae]|uniref:helix-turn-helix domain-containing protein n=1 Tax=Microbacterium gorillae TaxID=1231063 RepID=UPI003D99B151